MAACMKLRGNLLYSILKGNKNANSSYCAMKSYTRALCSAVNNKGLNQSSSWRRLHSSLMSTTAAETNIEETSNTSINIAVCIERVPVLTPSKTDIELQYEELQETLEFEHSSLSDYEVSERTMCQKKEQLKKDDDNEQLKKEVAALDSEYQELKDIEEQHVKDITLASRLTEADTRNDQGTPIRKLEKPLFLLTPNKENSKTWQMPHGNVELGETLRQAAERIAEDIVPSNISLQFMSNAPAGVYRKAEKDGVNPDTPKVFFYHVQLQSAMHNYIGESWSNCIWASKDELSEYLPTNYYKSVVKFIL